MAALPPMIDYSNEAIDLTISVPEDWSEEEVSANQFRLFGLPESGFEDYFDEYRCTMSYLLGEPEDSDETDWFETLIRDSQQEIAEDYNEYQLISEEHNQIDEHPVYVHYYEWTEENTDLRLSQLQALIRANDSSFYLINAAALKPLEEKYLPIFKAILKSTKILKKS